MMKPFDEVNPFSSIDPVLKFKEIKNLIDKMNKYELLRINCILEKRLDELNRFKKECTSNNK